MSRQKGAPVFMCGGMGILAMSYVRLVIIRYILFLLQTRFHGISTTEVMIH
jgi:hypothetical protein